LLKDHVQHIQVWTLGAQLQPQVGPANTTLQPDQLTSPHEDCTLECAGKHATLHNFRFIFRTSHSLRTLRFPYTEVLSSLGFRPDLDMLLLPVKYL
jgi:hypothetical protein